MPLAIGDVPAMVVWGCWKIVTFVAPVSVPKAESDATVNIRLAVDPLVTAVAIVPLKPCGFRATS